MPMGAEELGEMSVEYWLRQICKAVCKERPEMLFTRFRHLCQSICVEDEHVRFKPSCCLREFDVAEEGEEAVLVR